MSHSEEDCRNVIEHHVEGLDGRDHRGDHAVGLWAPSCPTTVHQHTACSCDTDSRRDRASWRAPPLPCLMPSPPLPFLPPFTAQIVACPEVRTTWFRPVLARLWLERMQ